ncbi:MAG: DUF2911 domain-containing protein [Bacteroidota bacterium]
MRNLILCTLMLGISWASTAQIKVPALSPTVEIKQQIGLTTATLSYSRPSLRGRSLFGKEGILVQGQKWRTGANGTTKLSFSKDVEISGQLLSKGTYALLSTPQEESWTFHFYPYETGAYTQFLDKQPTLEITVPIQRLSDMIETLSLHFEALQLDAAELVLQWGNTKAVLPIQLKEHASILTNIERELQGPSNFDYFQAALYLHETQTDLPQALQYIQEVTQHDSALFFQVHREALILSDLDRKAEAIKVAKRAMELAEKVGNDDFVRLNEQLIEALSK